MIDIVLNAQPRSLMCEMPLIEAIAHWKKEEALQSPFSIAVNDHFIPRSEYAHVRIKPGDSVEVLVPMQGG